MAIDFISSPVPDQFLGHPEPISGAFIAVTGCDRPWKAPDAHLGTSEQADKPGTFTESIRRYGAAHARAAQDRPLSIYPRSPDRCKIFSEQFPERLDR
jgi:hypothetical protein